MAGALTKRTVDAATYEGSGRCVVWDIPLDPAQEQAALDRVGLTKTEILALVDG